MKKFKLHIRGPFKPTGGHAGLALWVCYDPDNVHQSCASVSPMVAYRTWYALFGVRPE